MASAGSTVVGLAPVVAWLAPAMDLQVLAVAIGVGLLPRLMAVGLAVAVGLDLTVAVGLEITAAVALSVEVG